MNQPAPVSPVRACLWTAAAAAVLMTLYGEARIPLWSNHLGGDLTIFFMRVTAFIKHESLVGTEYQPGALYWFWFAWLLSNPSVQFHDVMMLLAAALLTLHLSFVRAWAGAAASWWALAFFLLAGPVFFFRFDLFVSLLVLFALYAWHREWTGIGGFLLGWAVTVKLYPVLLLPFMLRRRGEWAWRVAGGFGLALLLVLVIYVVNGGSVRDLVDTLMYHARKPISIESTWGALGLLSDAMTGVHHRLLYENITYGLALPDLLRHVSSLCMLVSLGSLYWLSLRARGLDAQGDLRRMLLSAHLAIFSVLAWSTLYIPQYILWLLGFTALLPLTAAPPRRARAIMALYAVALLAEQYVFPCHFSLLLEVAQGLKSSPSLLAVLLLGKTAFLAAYILLWREFLDTPTEAA